MSTTKTSSIHEMASMAKQEKQKISLDNLSVLEKQKNNISEPFYSYVSGEKYARRELDSYNSYNKYLKEQTKPYSGLNLDFKNSKEYEIKKNMLNRVKQNLKDMQIHKNDLSVTLQQKLSFRGSKRPETYQTIQDEIEKLNNQILPIYESIKELEGSQIENALGSKKWICTSNLDNNKLEYKNIFKDYDFSFFKEKDFELADKYGEDFVYYLYLENIYGMQKDPEINENRRPKKMDKDWENKFESDMKKTFHLNHKDFFYYKKNVESIENKQKNLSEAKEITKMLTEWKIKNEHLLTQPITVNDNDKFFDPNMSQEIYQDTEKQDRLEKEIFDLKCQIQEIKNKSYTVFDRIGHLLTLNSTDKQISVLQKKMDKMRKESEALAEKISSNKISNQNLGNECIFLNDLLKKNITNLGIYAHNWRDNQGLTLEKIVSEIEQKIVEMQTRNTLSEEEKNTLRKLEELRAIANKF